MIKFPVLQQKRQSADLLKIETKTGKFQIFASYIIGFHLQQILGNWHLIIYLYEDSPVVLNDITSNIDEVEKQLNQIMDTGN